MGMPWFTIFSLALALLTASCATDSDTQGTSDDVTGSESTEDSSDSDTADSSPDDTGADPDQATEDPCTEEPAEVWSSATDVDPSLRQVDEDTYIEAFGVRALRGCESLDGPLAAMNWWTVRDPEADDSYSNAVVPLLLEMGAKIIFTGDNHTTVRVPEGTVADGTPWLQETLQLPLYPSPEAFTGMLSSEAWLSAGGYKLNETSPEDYDFVFMKCFYGCEAIQANEGFLAFTQAPTVAHLFNAVQDGLREAIETLAYIVSTEGLGRVAFGGYAWALPIVRLDPTGIADGIPNGFWNDGLIVLFLERETNVEDVLALDAYQDLMETTENDTIVLFNGNLQ